ncbi:macrophage mannose receptor 1-like [Physella acuta]|uniref:macrophage mannose receptor 1-like n=1 Tax=Physella acuta TaxID=109671 RepID=UPI0027DE2228|nr:macrophage mannose receptor 1-like [Physella acuta]
MNELKSWDDAMTSCVNMGGTLATVADLTEWDDIKFYLHIGPVNVWIGANKKMNKITYVWTDDLNQATELNGMWAAGYPKSTAGYDCVFLLSEAFNDPCSNTYSYLCMEPAVFYSLMMMECSPNTLHTIPLK